MKKRRSLWIYASLFFATFMVDRFTKALILWWGVSKVCITSFLSLHLSFNRGISWGMLHSDRTGPFIAVTLLSLVIIIPLAIHTYFRWRRGFSVWGETLAMSGALSNLFDRILYGGVLDFISFAYGNWYWPIFNIADVCIVSGVFLILITFSREG
ncbi:signal peptidase II [Candidatus Dependentiae bacterium]